MTALTASSTPTRSWKKLAVAAAGAGALALGYVQYQSYVATQEANARFEAAVASAEICTRHDAIKNVPAMQKSIELAASKLNPAILPEVSTLIGGLTYALAQPGVMEMPVYGKGVYAMVPASKEAEELKPMQILMQGKDGQCYAFGMTSEGKIVAPSERVQNAIDASSSLRTVSSHGQAPACDRALRSLSGYSI